MGRVNEEGNCAVLVLENAAEITQKQSKAIVFGDEVWSFAEIDQQSNRIANLLRSDYQVSNGHYVGLICKNTPLAVAAWFAIVKSGGVVVWIPPLLYPAVLAESRMLPKLTVTLAESLHEPDLESCSGLGHVCSLQKSPKTDPRLSLYSEQFAVAETAASDTCVVLFTSGSTGQPKRVSHSHSDVMSVCRSVSQAFNFTVPDSDTDQQHVILSTVPFSSAYGLGSMLLPIYARACQVLIDYFCPENCFELLAKNKVSGLFSTPNAYLKLSEVQKGTALKHLRVCCSAGACLSERVWKQWYNTHGAMILEGYGTTETLSHVLSCRQDAVRFGSVGKPLPGYELKLVDARGRRIKDGSVGKLLVREASNRLVRQSVKGDGWLDTGDLFLKDKEGFFWFKGRLRSRKKLGGQYVYSVDIERALLALEWVKEAAIILPNGSASDTRIKAYVACDRNHLTRDLNPGKLVSDHLQTILPAKLLPQAVFILEALPRTWTGKVNYPAFAAQRDFDRNSGGACRELRIFLEKPIALDRKKESVSEWLESQLRVHRHEVASAQQPNGHQNWGASLDSLSALSMARVIESAIGRDFPVSNIFEVASVAELADRILAKYDPAGWGSSQSVHENSGFLKPSQQPLAIVGMSCRFAGCSDYESFWQLLSSDQDVSCEVPVDRWQADKLKTTNAAYSKDLYFRRGYFIESPGKFDSEFFGYSPREANLIDPQQRLLLEGVWHALEDAGIPPAAIAGEEVGVFVGMMGDEYNTLLVKQEVSDFYKTIGNMKNAAAGRISYFFGLEGPSLTIDTGCSASLTALHFARLSLEAGECHTAIVASASLQLSPDAALENCIGGVLAKDGRSKTFDQSADGYGRGEGLGVVVLKKLASAQQEGLNIHSILRATAANQNGAGKGFTAPSVSAQRKLYIKALRSGGLKPGDVGMVEVHGSGTRLGDPIEYEAIKSVFGSREKSQPLLLTAVKPHIGHLEAAAGIAGLIKTILSTKNGKVPPILRLHDVNHEIAQTESLHLTKALSEWPSNAARIGMVSSLGLSGSNAVAVVEAWQSSDKIANPAAGENRSNIYVFSAKSPKALDAYLKQFYIWLGDVIEVTDAGRYSAANIAHTLQSGRSHLNHRLAVVASSKRELHSHLAEITAGHHCESAYSGHAREYEKLMHGPMASVVGKKFINELVSSGDLHSLAQMWACGCQIDLPDIYHYDSYPVCVGLPTYCFQGQTHWVSSRLQSKVHAADARHIPEADAIVAAAVHEKSSVAVEDAVGAASHVEKDVKHLPRIVQMLTALIAELLEISAQQIDDSTAISEYGFDSYTYAQLSDRMNGHFGVKSTPTLFFQYATICELARWVSENSQPEIVDLNLDHSTVSESSDCNRNDQDTDHQRAIVERERFTPIAIIGMAGILPGSSNLQEFWQNLVDGKDMVVALPQERAQWMSSFYNAEAFTELGSVAGGYIPDVSAFDARFFGISPREAELMDPQQRLLLEVVWTALENASIKPEKLRGTSTGVFVGASCSDYRELIQASELDIDGYNATGDALSILANRVSFLFDLRGPSETIDTACASSFIALNRACRALHSKECDQVIIAAANLLLSPKNYIAYHKAGMLSKHWRCKTFDSAADGYVRSEGVGALVLKRVEDAEMAHDCIHALVRSAVAIHAGKAPSLTAPTVGAQIDLIKAAYAQSGIDPRSVSYIEAHGTGTPLGDPIEMEAIKKAFRDMGAWSTENDRSHIPKCLIGSVKSNIGHLEACAGLAGVFKVILSMQHGYIPGNLHFRKLNSYIDLEGSRFSIATKGQSWESTQAESHKKPLVASLSSFGYGGMIGHVILEQYLDSTTEIAKKQVPLERPYIIPLSAKNKDQLLSYAKNLLAFIERSPDISLENVAYTLQVGREAMDTRLAMIVNTVEDLVGKLSGCLTSASVSAGVFIGDRVSGGDALTDIASDNEITETVEKWFAQGKYDRLLRLWVKGLAFDWERLYGECKLQRISLPTYPFARKRYWAIDTHSISGVPRGAQSRIVERSVGKTHKSDGTDEFELLMLRPVWTPFESMASSQAVYERTLTIVCDAPLPAAITESDTLLHWVSNKATVTEKYREYCGRLLQCLRQEMDHKLSGSTRLQLIVPSQLAAAPEVTSLYAGLYGMLQSAHWERRELIGQLIEVEESALVERWTEIIAAIRMLSGLQRIRYHCGVVQYLHWEMATAVELSTTLWRDHGVYLITGGAGGLGVLFAEEIARRAQGCTVILVGRSKKGEAIKEVQARLEAQRIKVEYRQADVSDRQSVQALLQEIVEVHGQLNGILHSAGSTADRLIVNKTQAELGGVLAAKVDGLVNLDECSRQISLDFMALFSSISGSLGNAGQADYAAANAFMDSYAYYRNALVTRGERSGQTVSINWPLWRSGGMNVSSQHYNQMRALTGLVGLTAAQGIELFYRCMGLNVPQVMLLLGDVDKIRGYFGFGDAPGVTTDVAIIRETMLGSTSDNVRENISTVQQFLLDTVSDLLKIPTAELDLKTELMQYGLDSIAQSQLIGCINLRYELSLAPGTLMDYPDLASLAQYLLSYYLHKPMSGVDNIHRSVSRAATVVLPPANEEVYASEQLTDLTAKARERYAPFPLTDIQESFLVGRKLSRSERYAGSHIYLEMRVMDPDRKRLEKAWNRLVSHHEGLRIKVCENGHQYVQEHVPYYEIAVSDLRSHSEVERADLLEEQRANNVHRVYAVNEWPLFDVGLTYTTASEGIVRIGIDELVCDGPSLNMLLGQWVRLYQNNDAQLPATTTSFRDYVVELKSREQQAAYQSQLNYWLTRRETYPAGPALPWTETDCSPALVGQLERIRGLDGQLNAEKWSRIKDRANQLGVTPTTLMLTLFSEILTQWSQHPEFCLLLTIGRRPGRLRHVVGNFVSSSLYVVDSQDGATLQEKVQHTYEQIVESMPHLDVSGVRVLRELRRANKLPSNTYYPVVFTSMLNSLVNGEISDQPTVLGETVYSANQTPQVYLDHRIFERDGALLYSWFVADDAFKPGVVDRMFADYVRLLDAAAADAEFWAQAAVVSPLPRAFYIAPVPEDEAGDLFPLTDLQQAYVVGRSEMYGLEKTSCQVYQEIEMEDLDFERLQWTWRSLIAAHDMLRVEIQDSGVQRILAEVPAYNIQVEDLSDLTAASTEQSLERIRQEMTNHVFVLNQWPLFELRVSQLARGRARLHLSIDLLIADGPSIQLLLSQLFAAYSKGKRPQGPQRIRFRDYVLAQQQLRRQQAVAERYQRYWQAKFATLPAGGHLQIRSDRLGGNGRHTARLAGELAGLSELKAKALQHSVSLNGVVLAAYQETLLAWNEGKAFSVLFVNWDRYPIHPEIDQVVGDFTGLSWLGCSAEWLSFIERVRQVEAELERDYWHSPLSGLSVLRKVGQARKLSFPIVFTGLMEKGRTPWPQNVKAGYRISKTAGVAIDCFCHGEGERLHFHWDLNLAAVSMDVAEAMFEYFEMQLQKLVNDSTAWDLPLEEPSESVVKYASSNWSHDKYDIQREQIAENVTELPDFNNEIVVKRRDVAKLRQRFQALRNIEDEVVINEFNKL